MAMHAVPSYGATDACGQQDRLPGDACHLPGKQWDAWGSKQQPSSPKSSAWSTQDGYGACFDPDRDSSIECAPDIARHSRWTADLQGKSDQDCFATCTSRSTDLQAKQGLRHKHESAQLQQPAHSDAAALPDNHRSTPAQTRVLTKAEQQRLRSCRQLDDLLVMIRNEQTLESELSPSAGLLEQQGGLPGDAITPQMLTIVSSWLSEVAYEFSMQQETLFLAVTLLGRFLQASTGVPRGVLQLVAVACIMLAAKQDEVVHPSVQELTDIAANCFTAQDLLRMERILLDTLSWRIKTPTAYTFLHLYTQSTAALRAAGGVAAASAAGALAPQAHVTCDAATAQRGGEPLSGAVVAKAAFLTELALLDPGMLAFPPSRVAAAALLLAESWSPQGAAVEEMWAISGFGPAGLEDCTARLLHLHSCAAAADTAEALAPFVFIRDKYAQECWLKASLQPAPMTSVASPAAAAAAPAAPGDIAAAAAAWGGNALLPAPHMRTAWQHGSEAMEL